MDRQFTHEGIASDQGVNRLIYSSENSMTRAVVAGVIVRRWYSAGP